MIEECEDILECENKLSLITQKVSLLGEFHLSVEEVDKLGTFIKEQISENIQKGIEFLKTKTPTCLACFLVWMGIIYYKDGDYWSGIRESTGLSDPNWQARLGEIFINFLKANRLVFCDIQDAHRYITPILIHGMIPNSCLDEYFQEILMPMVKHELADSTDHKEISFLLKNRREDDKDRKAIEEEIRKLQTNKYQISNKLSRESSLIEIWDDLEKTKALEKKVGNPDELASLPEDPSEYKSKKNVAIQNLKKEIEKLEKEKRQYEQQRKKFSEIDKEVLANLDAIIQCINILPGLEQQLRKVTEFKAQENMLKEQIEKHAESIFSKRWDECYILLIREIPFDKLKDKIEAFNSRRISKSGARQGYFKNILRVIKEWANYFFSRIIKREKTAQEIQVEISEILKDLPIDKRAIEWPQTELVHKLKQLWDNHETVCDLCEIRKSIEKECRRHISKIKNAAEAVGVDNTDDIKYVVMTMQNKLADAQRNRQSTNQSEQEINNIENNITELKVKKLSLAKEIQKIIERLVELGKGDFKLGIERLEQRRDAQLKRKLLRNDLMRKYPDLKILEQEKYEAQKDDKDKSYYHLEINGLDVEIEQIKQRIIEFTERLKQIPTSFPYVDEPIRRFLLYGGDTAKDFLIQSVQMVNHAMEEQKVPSLDKIGLPERVVTRFGELWREHEKNKEKEIDDRSPVQKSQERFRTPMIYLDTAIGEIKVHFPSQRLSDEIIGLCLIINEDKPDLHKEQLRVYKYNENIFKTEEFDFLLPFPSASYEFTLKNGSQVIRSWNIQGISPDRPFMAFTHDIKKLIKETELPKEKVWIVLYNKSDFEPSRSIIEKASLYGKWKEYKYKALDLSDAGQLYLVDEQGKKKSIPISQERIFEPVLYGNPLRGCRSEEENIYIGEPPVIRIPIETDAEIERWIISILKNSDNILAESRHYRLSDLKEISQIDKEKGIFEIPLSNEKCIGKNVVGRFTVRLKNDSQYIDRRFSFCVVPNLKVEFDKDIYLPYEGDTPQVYLRLEVHEQMEFEPLSLAKIVGHEKSSYRIGTSSLEDTIYGILKYLSKDYSILMPITIEIPRLTWRLDGLPNNEYSSESNRIEEIWFGDWERAEESLSLIVSMPTFVCGQGQLSLHDSERRPEAKITDGRARFDLLGFSDILRSGEPLQIFKLTVPDSEPSIDNVDLFKIRTRWEVEDIECVQKFYNGMLILDISWKKEKGKPEGQRIVRLWRIWEPDLDPITKQVPQGDYNVTIKKSSVELPVGRYLVHLDVEDPWSGKKVSFPSIMTLNTIEIQINPYTETPQSILITSVLDENGQIYKLDKYEYIIYIVGKIISRKLPATVDNNGVLVKKINEGWYVGEVSVTTGLGAKTKMDGINPVKFEYDSQNLCIETIEDKEGDGVYFCPLCKNLFWNNKHYEKEKGKGHEKDLLTGNIKFKIKNKF